MHAVDASRQPRVSRRAALVAAVATLARVSAGRAAQATPAGDVGARLPTPGALPAATPRAGSPLKVVATTGILADLVRQVGGSRVDAASVLPANADPHEFEPKPADLVAVEGAQALVRHGLGLDVWSDTIIEGVAAGLPVITATDGITPLVAEHDGASEPDPHVWFDPRRVMTMVDTIAAGLAKVDPDGQATYAQRAAAYNAQLADLDAAIAAAVATIPPERRKLVTNHDALAYYADRYGLTIVGTVIPGLDTSAEPSAADVADLIATIKRENAPAVFAENTTSPALAERLAAEAGVRVVDDLYTDNLGDRGSGADTYLGLMRTDTTLIVEALR